MAKKSSDASTENKIKAAARKLFVQKGFAATRTRDIAEEAGINLALLNYYFRGKQNLFDIIMEETLLGFVGVISKHFHNPDTSVEQKLQLLSEAYIEFLLEHPDVPIFILSELRNQKREFFAKMAGKLHVRDSVFYAQLRATYGASDSTVVDQVLMNLFSLIMFPMLGAPVVKLMLGIGDEEYVARTEVRKQLIPTWIASMFLPSEK